MREGKEQQLYQYDAVVVLGSGLRKIEDKYYPTDYRDADQFGMYGGGMRIVAAIDLYLGKQAKTFIFTTGKTEKFKTVYGQDIPPEANVHADKFTRSLTALSKKPEWQEKFKDTEEPEIILEDRSTSTLTNIQEVLQIILDRDLKKVAIVSSDYHIPRVKALYEEALKKHPEIKAEITFISAESEVKKDQPGKYEGIIDEAYKTPIAKTRLAAEKKGLDDLKAGKYSLQEFQLKNKDE
jgi:uncharacterized SAM-binding protein YcdF (DUF218 family)